MATRSSFWPYLSIVSALVTIVVNGLANALPLNGLNTGEISDRFQVYFVPAGYVFSIWGLIYLLFVAFVIYAALPGQRENARLARIHPLFVLTCVANVAWLFLWHYEQFSWTLVAMIALLLLLISIYLRLQIGRVRVSAGERWSVRLLFSVYLGWISVATIANVTDVLYYWKWSGWGVAPEIWAAILLIAALVLASAAILTRGDVAYALVILWAVVGIAVKQANAPTVATTAWVVAAAVSLVVVMRVLGRVGPSQVSMSGG